MLKEVLALVEAGGRIPGYRLLQKIFRGVFGLPVRGHDNAHGGIAIHCHPLEAQVQGQFRLVPPVGDHREYPIFLPFVLEAGDQGTLQCGLVCLPEQVHEGLADQFLFGFHAQEGGPGRIYGDDDAIVNVGDSL